MADTGLNEAIEAAARLIYSGTDLAPKPAHRVGTAVIEAVYPIIAAAVRAKVLMPGVCSRCQTNPALCARCLAADDEAFS